MQIPWDSAVEADNVKCKGPEVVACHAHSITQRMSIFLESGGDGEGEATRYEEVAKVA